MAALPQPFLAAPTVAAADAAAAASYAGKQASGKRPRTAEYAGEDDGGDGDGRAATMYEGFGGGGGGGPPSTAPPTYGTAVCDGLPPNIKLPATGPVDQALLRQLPLSGPAFDTLILRQSILQDFSGPVFNELLARITCCGRVDGYHAPINVMVDVPVYNPGLKAVELSRQARALYVATPPLMCMRAGLPYRAQKGDGTLDSKASFTLKVSCPLPRQGEKRTVGLEVKEGLARLFDRLEDVAYANRISIFQRDVARKDVHFKSLVDWSKDDGIEHQFPPQLTFKVECKGKGDAARPKVDVYDMYGNTMDWSDIATGDSVTVIAAPVIWLFQGGMGLSLIATQIQVRRLVPPIAGGRVDLGSLRTV